MPANTQYDVRPAQIITSNEVSAFTVNGDKVVAAPLQVRRHIFSENIVSGTSRLLLETNSNQSWYFQLYVTAPTIDYRIDCVQNPINNANVVSTINAPTVTGTGNKLIYGINSTYDLYRDLILPPDCLLYITANSLINTVLFVGNLYSGHSLTKAG